MEFLRSLSPDALLQVAAIFVLAWLVYALVNRTLPVLAERLKGPEGRLVLATIPIFRLAIVFLAGWISVRSVINPTFDSLVALLGALGLALGFAFKDYASSLLGGIVTLFELPYRVGDWVRIDGVYGEVRAVNMRTLAIQTPDDDLVTVPHLKLWTERVENSTAGASTLLCLSDFYLDPDHDGMAALAVLEDVALTSAFLHASKPLRVASENELGCVRYQILAYPVSASIQRRFKTDLSIRGRAALLAAGFKMARLPAAPSA